MICPNCLSNNRKGVSVCRNCGCPLDETGDPLHSAAASEAHTRSGASAPRYTVKEVIASDIDCDKNTVESELSQDTINISPIRNSSAPVRKSKSVHSGNAAYSTRSKKKRRAAMIFTLILWVVVLGAIITGVVLGVKYVSDLFNNTVPNVSESPSKQPASTPDIAVMTDESGKEYINCVFYGQDGDSVLISQINKRYTFENGKAEFNLYLSDLLSSTAEITSDTVPVTLKAIYRYSDGTETEVSVPTAEFTVPSTEIQLLNTDSKAIEIYKDSFTVVFAIPKGSNLYINDAISNDKIESTGRVKYTVNVGIGESVQINIRAQAPYHKSAEAMFTVYRQELHTKFTLANSNPKTTETNVINITGTTSKGTVITCGGDYKATDYTFNESTGVFTMKITLPVYGTHDIVLTATDTEGKTARLTHTVNYMPNEDTYTRRAWAYESGVASNPGQFMNKSFLFKNVKIQEFILSEDTLFLINMGTESEPEYIYVRYGGNMNLNTSTTYRIFGDVTGVYNGKTLVDARFIYNW